MDKNSQLLRQNFPPPASLHKRVSGGMRGRGQLTLCPQGWMRGLRLGILNLLQGLDAVPVHPGEVCSVDLALAALAYLGQNQVSTPGCLGLTSAATRDGR